VYLLSSDSRTGEPFLKFLRVPNDFAAQQFNALPPLRTLRSVNMYQKDTRLPPNDGRRIWAWAHRRAPSRRRD